jgi:hypothetical protein
MGTVAREGEAGTQTAVETLTAAMLAAAAGETTDRGRGGEKAGTAREGGTKEGPRGDGTAARAGAVGGGDARTEETTAEYERG